MPKENEEQQNEMMGTAAEEVQADADLPTRLGWREAFRQAFDKARREQRPVSRRELGRDRSRSLFLLAGVGLAVLLLFFSVFSSSSMKKRAGTRPSRTPDLGRRVNPEQARTGQTGSATPLLNAQTGQPDTAADQNVTPEDIGRTARPLEPALSAASPRATNAGDGNRYALGRVNFSETAPNAETLTPSKSSLHPPSDDLRKASLVFVRGAETISTSSQPMAVSPAMEDTPDLNLSPGTRLVARLQSSVSSALKTPVVAAIEYNYERNGEIVVPAGAQVFGSLQQVNRSGYVGIRFDTIQMPDGSTENIDATAMSLNFGPLKGVVTGKRTGTNFLIRAFTGIGQAASYLVGSNGLNAPLSQGALLRDQIATNIGIAGDQQLNTLAFSQDIVVSVPGNTRFYVVIEKNAATRQDRARSTARSAGNGPLQSAEDLLQLMQLRRELSELYQQSNAQKVPQQ
jgi:hypothetical protein